MKIAMFVYGTLRIDAPSWGLSGGEEVIRDARIAGKLYSYRFSYPVAKLNETPGEILGDIIVYDTDDPSQALILARITNIEIGAGYERREVVARLDGGGTRMVQAWDWRSNPRSSGLKEVPDGDWLAYKYGTRSNHG